MQTDLDQLAQLVKRAEAGDADALAEAHQLFDSKPDLWHQVGDLARTAESTLLDVAAGQNVIFKEALERRHGALKTELAGPDATVLERLLAQRVAICWLQLAHADLLAIEATDLAPARAELYEKRQTRSQQRLLAAIKVFGVVRKLLRPAVSPLDVAQHLAGDQRAMPRRHSAPSQRHGSPVAWN